MCTLSHCVSVNDKNEFECLSSFDPEISEDEFAKTIGMNIMHYIAMALLEVDDSRVASV